VLAAFLSFTCAHTRLLLRPHDCKKKTERDENANKSFGQAKEILILKSM